MTVLTTPVATKTLRVGLLVPIRDPDPWGKQDFESTMILAHVFEPPLGQPDGEAAPEPLLLADPLRKEKGSDAWSARVRPDVRFSDGTPLTPELLARSLTRSTVFHRMAEVEVRDDRVVFHPRRPGVRLDLLLAQRVAGVVLEKDGELLGTGPYRIDPSSTPERTLLVRNPEYRGTVDIEQVELTTYPPNADGEPEALIEAFERGEVDFCNVVSREHIGRLKGVRKWFEPGSGTTILYLNTRRPALADPKARQGLAAAIDRAAVARTCYPNPVAFTAAGLVPPMMGSFRDGLTYDPKRANVLLRSSEGGRPERLTLLLIHGPRPYLPQPRAVADEIARQLGEIGIGLEIRQAETLEDYFRQAARGDYDLALSGWLADSTDPADFLETILSSDSIPGTGLTGSGDLIDGNLSHWENEAVERAIERLADDPSEDHKREILRILDEEVPLVPLMYGPTIFAYALKVLEFQPSPLGIPDFARMKLME